MVDGGESGGGRYGWMERARKEMRTESICTRHSVLGVLRAALGRPCSDTTGAALGTRHSLLGVLREELGRPCSGTPGATACRRALMREAARHRIGTQHSALGARTWRQSMPPSAEARGRAASDATSRNTDASWRCNAAPNGSLHSKTRCVAGMRAVGQASGTQSSRWQLLTSPLPIERTRDDL